MTDHNAKRLVESLNTCLYAWGSDAPWEALETAADIVKVLISEGFEELISKETIEYLSKGNIEETNYLEVKCKCGEIGYDDHTCPCNLNNKDFRCTCCERCIILCGEESGE